MAALIFVYQFLAHWVRWYVLYLFALVTPLYANRHIRRTNLIFSLWGNPEFYLWNVIIILFRVLVCAVCGILTPWCRVLLEKLTGLQLVKKLPWASPIQSIYTHPTSWRSILILSAHLRLGLPSGLLPSGFPTKTLYTPSPHP